MCLPVDTTHARVGAGGGQGCRLTVLAHPHPAPYFNAVDTAFAHDVDYAQIVKS